VEVRNYTRIGKEGETIPDAFDKARHRIFICHGSRTWALGLKSLLL
jgi:hypothetical protein